MAGAQARSIGQSTAPDRTPHLDQAAIENRHLLAAVEHLAWMREEGGRLRVNWRDMETEELGSVYESLLELTPRASASERTFAFAEGAETNGNARKTSGSYYTEVAPRPKREPLIRLTNFKFAGGRTDYTLTPRSSSWKARSWTGVSCG